MKLQQAPFMIMGELFRFRSQVFCLNIHAGADVGHPGPGVNRP